MSKSLVFILLVALSLAGCASDNTEVQPDEPTGTVGPGGEEGNQTANETVNEPTPSEEVPTIVVNGTMGVRIDLSGGNVVHRLQIDARESFDLAGISYHSDGSSATNVHYGIALWSDLPDEFSCKAVEMRVWDSIIEDFNVDWNSAAGTYDLWVWNFEGGWLGLEFNAGEATESSDAFAPIPTEWTYESLQSEWVDGGSGATFTETVTANGLFYAKMSVPNGISLESSATASISLDEPCDQDSGASTFGERVPDLELSASFSGTATWTGDFDTDYHMNAGGSAAAIVFTHP